MHLVGSWDVIHYEVLRPDQTVTSELYQQQLIRVLPSKKKYCFTGSERRTVMLLQDNSRPHTSKKTQETISNLHWEIVPHGTYYPYLARSDYPLFTSLQHHLAESQFKSVKQVKKRIDEFVTSKLPSFLRSGIR